MVKVSIRVQSGATRFDVAVVAESAEQAVRPARGHYLTSDVRVKAPTGLEGFVQRARWRREQSHDERRRPRKRPVSRSNRTKPGSRVRQHITGPKE
jgi:hypothetical protein